jgi:GAF domain-containing protein
VASCGGFAVSRLANAFSVHLPSEHSCLKVKPVDDHPFSAAINHAARTIGLARTPEETLQTIAETALLSIPGIEHVGVSVLDDRGTPQTKAATSDLVWELDKLQYSLDEGPCVQSLRDATVVAAPRIREDSRWPRYAPAAVELGLKAQLAVKLYLDDRGTVGGLNMYSTESEDIDPEAPGIADLFATHAALALGKARLVNDLQAALRTREVISQAVGLLMGKYQLEPDTAFGFLVRTSSHSNTKIREIAASMVEHHIAEVKNRK